MDVDFGLGDDDTDETAEQAKARLLRLFNDNYELPAGAQARQYEEDGEIQVVNMNPFDNNTIAITGRNNRCASGGDES